MKELRGVRIKDLCLLCILFFILDCSCLRAQERKEAELLPSFSEFLNRLAFFTGTTIIPTHVGHNISQGVLFIPTYGIEYQHKVSRCFSLGIDNELELQHYVIQDEENHEITRNYIYVVTALVYFKPGKHYECFVGAGHEFTGSQNYTVLKIGMEYCFNLSQGWDLSPEISLDQVGNLYTAFTFGLSIGKEF